MPYCCVPFCTSNSKKKQPGVSFHEIPADVVSREQWLKAISRKDWQPNTTSNYSVVCSNHFKNSCFKTTTKTRRLIQGAVPTKFEGYPSYMKPASAKQRSTQSVNKRKREPPATVKVQDVQRTLQATTARLQHVDLGLLATPSSDVDDDTPGVLHPHVIDEPAAKRLEHETPDSSQPGSCHSSHTARSNEVHHLLSVATTQRSAYARRECGTQTLKRNSSITFCERR